MMDKPDVDLWEKDFLPKMKEWVIWHVEHTELDNLKEFMGFFMKMSRGKMNPKTIEEAWNESKRRTETTSEVVEGKM